MDDFDLDILEAELNALTAEQQAELEAEFEALRDSDDWENPFNSKGQPSPGRRILSIKTMGYGLDAPAEQIVNKRQALTP